MGMNDLIRDFARELSLPTAGLRVLDERLPLTPSIEKPGVFAGSLRAAGLPVQAILIESFLSYSFFGVYDSGYALFSPTSEKRVKVITPDMQEEIVDPGVVQRQPIITIPPVGRTFRVTEVAPRKWADKHEIAIFYSATTSSAELAKQQVIPDLEALVGRAKLEGKEMIFIDAVGLIPEEAVHRYGLHDEAFKRALDALQREADGTREGRPIHETRSPLWREIYSFLAKNRVRTVVERYSSELDRSIKKFDKLGLAKEAVGYLLAGRIEDATEVMMQYLSEFHRLNCTRRGESLAGQIKQILDASESPLIVVVLREIGHYGALETLFREYPQTTKIVGNEKFTDLLSATSLVNFQVDVPEEVLRASAVRYCLKTLITPKIAGGRPFNEIVARFARTELDRLDEEAVRDIFADLHHPARIFLRSTPHSQELQDQLLHILKDRRIIPGELIEDPADCVATALRR